MTTDSSSTANGDDALEAGVEQQIPEDPDLSRSEIVRRNEEHKARAAGQAVAMVYDGHLGDLHEEHGAEVVATKSAGPTALLTTQEVLEQFEKGFRMERDDD